MAQNMYRVGDYVYFEISSAAPYQVRRIEELNKTPSGNVEAKVLCYYRRRDISPALLKIADRAECVEERSLINSRNRLIGKSSARRSGINGDAKEDNTSEDDSAAGSSENGPEKEADIKRDSSESPRPMQVDTGENDEDPKKMPEDKSKNDDDEEKVEGGYGPAGLPKGAENLTPKERHLLRQHELFLSRQVEALPATHIRGKCTVTLLSEVETPESYLGKDDVFFYSLVYDPVAMTLLADKGEIRVGDKYQCEVPEEMEPDALKDENKENGNLVIAEEESEDQSVVSTTEREALVYHPHHSLTDRDIDQFLIIARAVGTFSRALDTSSSMKLPSLHMTAAAASRDVTLFHAMALLHQANYDVGQAVKYLVPPPSKQHYPLDADKTTSHNTVSLGGPILCRDQMEEWSAAEANLFEEAIEKYGKDFNDIRGDFLPWKSLRDIVEYYYMWKTTNRYVEVKKSKAMEQESKLKQVYIPNYNKPNPNLVGPPNASGHPVRGTSACESCEAEESSQWYAWGPAHLQLRLCNECWTMWKKNGGLKRVHKYESYDLNGTASLDMLNAAQQVQAQKVNTGPLLTSTTLIKSNIALPITQTNRNGGIAGRPTGGQVIARLPASHPQQLVGQQKFVGQTNLPVGPKTRVAFYLNTTLSMRIARRLAPKALLNLRRSARRPFLPINGHAIKQYCTTRQPMEIIRAAKQIKGNKLPDAVLAQLAASIIASGSQFAAFTGSSSTTAQKRPQPMMDKSVPTAKRQHMSSSVPPHQIHVQQQQQTHHTVHHAPVVSQQHAVGGAATTSSHTHVSGVHHKSATAVLTTSKQTRAHSHDPKPVAAVPPLSLPTNVHLPPNLALQKAALLVAAQQASVSRAVAVASAAVAASSKDASSAMRKKQTPDSRWSGADERLLFLAGPRLKMLRKRICAKKMARRIALHPCRSSDFVTKQLPNLQGFFV
uniref:Metastasis-associated protein MTA3 n=1 Tax=Parascaris univalens TaxID=6257 RepID=A0A914ZVP2_PARUN